MARRSTDKPTPRQASPERRWYEAGIASLEAERKKLDEERLYMREDRRRLEYERMERETWDRARRVYDMATDVSEESAYELIANLSDWSHESDDAITVRLFSPGGDVISGLAIYDFVLGLRAAGTVVNTVALGWAASMASILLQMGETRLIAPNASVLIHEERTTYSEGWTEKITDMEDRLRFGQSLEARMDAILAARSTLTVEEMRARYNRKDWWLTADETVELGFADGLWRG